MFDKFVKEIETLTEKRTTMGIEEFLLDRAKKEGREEGIEKGIEKGREEGIELGAERTKKIHALKMMENGVDIDMGCQHHRAFC